MSGARASWVVAASLGAVEALKDQGVCRWNYVLRSMQQHAKTRILSYYQNRINLPAQSSSGAAGMVGSKMMRDVEKIRRTEKSLKKVMDLSCWGPSTVRF